MFVGFDSLPVFGNVNNEMEGSTMSEVKAGKMAAKNVFRSGRSRALMAGSSRLDTAPVVVTPVTVCLNSVCEVLWGRVIDRFVWDGDGFYSLQSDRFLFCS